MSSLFATPFDPYGPLLRQSARALLVSSMAPVQLFACPHLSSIGIEKGFVVSRMNDELEALGHELASTLHVAQTQASVRAYMHRYGLCL